MLKKIGCFIVVCLTMAILAACATSKKPKIIALPSADLRLGEALEQGRFEDAGVICLNSGCKDQKFNYQCTMVFDEELRSQLDLRLKWLAKIGDSFSSHEFAVKAYNIWLTTSSRFENRLPYELVYRLRNTRLGKIVLAVLKNNRFPLLVNRSEESQAFEEMREEFLHKYRSGTPLTASEMGRYQRVLHKALSNDTDSYKAVLLTSPASQTPRGTEAWLLSVPGGLFVNDKPSIEAINSYLNTY